MIVMFILIRKKDWISVSRDVGIPLGITVSKDYSYALQLVNINYMRSTNLKLYIQSVDCK